MDGQWNNTRRPPRRTKGILPVVRQLNSVRRETGRRFNNSFSLIKPASPGGAAPFSDSGLLGFAVCCDSLFMFVSGCISLHKHASLLPCGGRGCIKTQCPCERKGVTLCYGNTSSLPRLWTISPPLALNQPPNVLLRTHGHETKQPESLFPSEIFQTKPKRFFVTREIQRQFLPANAFRDRLHTI